MRYSGWILSFALVVAIYAAGCEKQDSATPASSSPPVTPANPSAPATPSASETTPSTPAIPTPDHTPATAAIGNATAATQAAADSVAANSAVATTEAQKLLDQALTYIKENKLELADKTITQLEGMKASLPTAMQTRVADARNLLNAAKTGGGKLPALPGLAK
jgi:hypothetical protein